MRVYPLVLLFASALVESISNASKATMTTLNYPQPEADNLKDIASKKLVMANETTDNEDRMNSNLVKARMKLLFASESSAAAVKSFETLFPFPGLQDPMVKQEVGRVISLIQSNFFKKLVVALEMRDKALVRQEYESLCKGLREHFKEDVLENALYHLRGDKTITPSNSVQKLLDAQMSYWGKEKKSYDDVLKILIDQEESREMEQKFQWNVERLKAYMESNPKPGRPLYATLYETLKNGYALKDKNADVPKMIADLPDIVTRTHLNVLVPRPYPFPAATSRLGKGKGKAV